MTQVDSTKYGHIDKYTPDLIDLVSTGVGLVFRQVPNLLPCFHFTPCQLLTAFNLPI